MAQGSQLIMDTSTYYLQGFHRGTFKKDENLSNLVGAINAIHNGTIKTGFELVEKYKLSRDLRPDVYTYDPAFVDILFSNNIPQLLRDVVGRDLCLAHIQLRISYPGKESYMAWHRDTHIYGGKLVGNIPPVHKIIFYPTVSGTVDSKIKILPGSHRRVFSNKIMDYLQVLFSKKKTISSSDSEFLLFNTELFHHVVPEKQEKGSFRLIYSFCEKEQLKNYDDAGPLIQMYQEKLKTI